MDIKLREPQEADAQVIAELANDYDVAKMVATMPYPYALKDAYEWLKRIAKAKVEVQGHSLVIIVDNKFAGSTGWFYSEKGALEIGYWVAKPYWGKGVAGKAVELMLDVIHQDLPNATEVMGQYMVENPASGRVLEKNGFVVCGEGDGCFSLGRGMAMPDIMMVKKL